MTAPLTFSHYAEYYGLRGAVSALRRVSLRRAGNIGQWIGRLGYRPLAVRRDVVERQVRAAFPGLSEPDVVQIAIASYEHLGRTTIETAIMPECSREEVLGMFERIEGWDVVERARAGGKGALLVSGHIGNWELGGSLIAARGIDLGVVTRRMENPLFDRYLSLTRQRLGMEVIPDAEAVRKVPRKVRAGGMVAFLFDQGAAGLASTWVPFFGRLAKTPKGPAVFALRLDAPLIFACAIRQPSGKYVMYFDELPVPRTGERDHDVDAIVATYTAALERWVRKYPGQYFWHHRRWKHQQPGTPPELGDPS
ncbi:MAG: lysophospholipid acyltransferase family protein [Gemmatimonadota bacterium]|nr:lysophospholipid acyltransferase family protein [Gemmatimonadota bacterium]